MSYVGVTRAFTHLVRRHLVRLLKLFRFLKLGRAIKQMEDVIDINPAYFRFAQLFISIMFLSHLIACL